MPSHEVRPPEQGRIIAAYSDSNPKMGIDNYRLGHRLTAIRWVYSCRSLCRPSQKNGIFRPVHQRNYNRPVRLAFHGQYLSTTWHAFSHYIRSRSKIHQPFLETIFPGSWNGSTVEHCIPSIDGWSERGYYMYARELLAAICRNPSSHLE